MNLRFFKLQSLKARVTLAMLGVFVLGAVLLGAYASGMLRQDLARELGAQQFATVSLLAAQVDDALTDRMLSLQARAEKISPAVLANATAMQQELETRVVLLGLFNGGIFVTRTDGVVIADTSRELTARTIGLLEGQDTLRVPNMVAKASAQVAGLGIGHLPHWLADPEIEAGRLVEMPLSEPRQPIPSHIAWRSRQVGNALAWFLEELEKTEQISALTVRL